MFADSQPLFLDGRLFPDGQPTQIEIRDGRVASVKPVDSLAEPAGSETWLVPGFFDLQVNGFAGRSFAEPALTIDDVEHIARAVLHARPSEHPARVSAGFSSANEIW